MTMTLSSRQQLTALGHDLPMDESKFGFLVSSNDLLDDPTALRERVRRHGYLYIKNYLDPDLVLEARRSVLERLASEGFLDPSRDLMDGIINPELLEEAVVESSTGGEPRKMKTTKSGPFRADLAKANREIERIVYGPEIQGFYDSLLGEEALHFDYTWCRAPGPGKGTPPHCDWVYMGRGTQELLTCWTPYGRYPLETGGLLILEKSHLQANRIRHYLDRDVDTYCENRPSEVITVKEKGGWAFKGWLSNRPDTLPDKFESRWLTSECWEPGDFITFTMRMIHGSLDNLSDQVRISTDVRYQPASQPSDERWIGPNPVGHSVAGKRGRIC